MGLVYNAETRDKIRLWTGAEVASQVKRYKNLVRLYSNDPCKGLQYLDANWLATVDKLEEEHALVLSQVERSADEEFRACRARIAELEAQLRRSQEVGVEPGFDRPRTLTEKDVDVLDAIHAMHEEGYRLMFTNEGVPNRNMEWPRERVQ